MCYQRAFGIIKNNGCGKAGSLVSLLLIIIVMTLTSCGGGGLLVFYEGERKESFEIGKIEIEDDLLLMSIDTLVKSYQPISQNLIEVLPGHHTLSVNYKSYKGTSIRPITLSFKVVGGHHYLAKARAGANFWTAWVMDASLDSLVAGYDDLHDVEHRGRIVRRNPF